MGLEIPAGAVIEFLRQRQLTRLDVEDDQYYQTEVIRGVTEDTRANSGDLSWISSKAIEENPGRLSQFRGSLLICPPDTSPPHTSARYLVPCDRPRLAFAEAVTSLFGGRLVLRWPAAPNASVSPDAVIGERVTLAPGVVIGPDVEIGDDVAVGPNSCIANTTINPRVRIGCNCSIGLPGFGYEKREDGTFVRFPQLGRVFIDSDVEIGSNVCIDRAALGVTHVSCGAKIDNLVHVAHNVRIGRNTLVIANTMIGGSTVVGDDVWLAPSAAIMNKVLIGDRAVVGLGAVVTRSVECDMTVVGNPARLLEKKR